ncbi:ROK family protein [Bacillus sp. 1P06AnD]|uniref:ROK family protein n=1 Tax=Bacillus sp. 1P06AnD TaxID=3132208 RepID=UPI0039A18DEA
MFKPFLEDFTIKNKALKDIYYYILKNGPVTKLELMDTIQLKQTTVKDKMEELLSKKYIKENGHGKSTGGRPPVLYTIEPRSAFIIGIQISRLETNVILVDMQLATIEQESFLLSSLHTPSIVLSKIKEIILSFIDKYEIPFEKLLGIGIGSIGPLDRKQGIIHQMESPLAPGWENIRIAEILSAEIPVKIMLENLVETAVLAEANHFSIPAGDILYCISGRGFGCGIMSNGELIRGKNGDTARFGHMIIEVNGRECSCGKQGCLIAYTSPYAIIENMRKNNPKMNSFDTAFENAQIDDVIAFLKQEKSMVESYVMESAYYLGIGIANMVTMYQSEYVILEGPLLSGYPDYYEKTVESARNFLDRREKITFSRGKLGEKTPALGAALLIQDSYFSI